MAKSEKTCMTVGQKPRTGVITRWKSQLAESEKTCRTITNGLVPEKEKIGGIREMIGRN